MSSQHDLRVSASRLDRARRFAAKTRLEAASELFEEFTQHVTHLDELLTDIYGPCDRAAKVANAPPREPRHSDRYTELLVRTFDCGYALLNNAFGGFISRFRLPVHQGGGGALENLDSIRMLSAALNFHILVRDHFKPFDDKLRVSDRRRIVNARLKEAKRIRDIERKLVLYVDKLDEANDDSFERLLE